MPPLRIPIDGLWRCLCPSIDTFAISKTRIWVLSSSGIARPRMRQLHCTSTVQNTSTSNSLYKNAEQLGTYKAIQPQSANIKNPLIPPRATSSRRPVASNDNLFNDFSSQSTQELNNRLRELPLRAGTYHEIAELVYYLIRVRGEKPALNHYDALVRANSDGEYGSVEVAKGLLKDMEELQIRGDAGFYHGVLLVLAIHPDYLLRGEILKMMKDRWFGLSPEGRHWHVVGLIRDRQFEMAIEKLEEMQVDQITIQAWLYDVVTFQLCEADELDEAWKLLKYRWEHDRNQIWSSVYYYLLDKFSRGFHYDGVKFIWKVRIQGDIIVPSDGICISVLNVAARYADPGLATSVMRVLSARRATLAPYHYEALISAYAGFGDLMTAFRLLTIMTKAGVEPTPSTTRPLYIYLSQSDSLPRKAWQTLEQLFEDGHVVPIAAVNVVIESYIAINHFDDAMDAYKNLHKTCEAGPDTETFNILFQGSTRNHSKDISMFLASEMHALGIPADNLTYDRLILVCLHHPDYEDAFRYLEEMAIVGADRLDENTGKIGWWMRKGTASLMVKVCVKNSDERVWGIIREMKERGMKTDTLERWVGESWTSVGDTRLKLELELEVEKEQLSEEEVRKRQQERLRQWNSMN